MSPIRSVSVSWSAKFNPAFESRVQPLHNISRERISGENEEEVDSPPPSGENWVLNPNDYTGMHCPLGYGFQAKMCYIFCLIIFKTVEH